MNTNKVTVTNMSSGKVVIISEDYHFRRELAPGRTIPIPEEVFEELSFDDGFQNLITDGAIKINGLTEENEGMLRTLPEESTVPVNEIKQILEDRDITKFAKMIPVASEAARGVVVQYAIELNITEPAFCALIKKYCDVDIVNAITTKRQATEE